MESFHSTRSTESHLTSKQAILKGIADDGGLFVNDSLAGHHIDASELAGKSYADIARTVLHALLPDFTGQELDGCIAGAYGDAFDDPRIAPVHRLAAADGTHRARHYILELFHGPTCAFKDIALQILPRFMAQAAAAAEPADPNAGKRIMILTATSGDTGKAALAGFADCPGTAITVFYTEGKVSDIQRLQMATQPGSNVRVCAVRGNFDDVQTAVKHIFTDQPLADRLGSEAHTLLSSANSINIGRLVPQAAYYFSAYAQLLETNTVAAGSPVDFIVPTGNFGNVLAGYYARLMGLPVGKLVVASDRNNVLYDFLTTGIYNRNREFYATSSPSMDILVSSNLERMLYYMSGGDTALICRLMDDLDRTGSFSISPSLLAEIREIFSCGWADENDVASAITSCWESYRYIIDPHTACGYHVMMQSQGNSPERPQILLSTASPYKFPRTVLSALDSIPGSVPGEAGALTAPGKNGLSDFQCMDILSSVSGTTPPVQLRSLDSAPVRFNDTVDIADMAGYVEQAAG